ncbi:unnamed protein product [Amaranthus hypochondriacus]
MSKEVDLGVKLFYYDSLSTFILMILLLVSYAFCYFFVRKLPKGIPRLISLLGVFYILVDAPWYFPSSIFLRGLASFFISWMSSFKLVQFSFDKGDLILCNSYVEFVAIVSFPFKKRNKFWSSEKDQTYTALNRLDMSHIQTMKSKKDCETYTTLNESNRIHDQMKSKKDQTYATLNQSMSQVQKKSKEDQMYATFNKSNMNPVQTKSEKDQTYTSLNQSNTSHVQTKSKKNPMYTILSNIVQLLLDNVLLVLALSISISTLTHELMIIFLIIFTIVPLCRIIMPQLEPIHILKEPYKATSIQNFWGRRWNQYSSYILRKTVYNPTQKLSEPLVRVSVGKIVALVVTLVISGLMHEMMFYHMTCGMKPTWEVTKFFVLQGICMALEIGIKRFWVRILGWPSIHQVFSVPLTLGLVIAMSYWLIFVPVWRIAGRECVGRGLGVELIERLLLKF